VILEIANLQKKLPVNWNSLLKIMILPGYRAAAGTRINWEVKEFPDKHLLDSLFPDRPVFLIRVDGHAAWVNSKALEIAGITKNTVVNGGKVLLTNGLPNGILIDEAMELVRKHIPKPDRETKINALIRAQTDCFAFGITSVADAGISVEEVKLIDSLQKNGALQMRIYAMLDPASEGFGDFVRNGIYITDRLTVRAIKLYADGALGSRGACLLEEYTDDPGNNGMMVTSPDSILKYAEIAKKYGWQLCIHAIGDSANRVVLQIYSEVLGGPNDFRWRIEHAQVIHPDDMRKFGEFNIIPSVQPTHATSDMYWAEARLGSERIKNAYAYKSLLRQNGWLCSGTDFPVEQINPFLTFYAAVSRKDTQGFPENGFQADNALSRKETLLSMTFWAAKAGFEDEKKGSIEPGKYADFVILDLDLMKLDPHWLPEVEVFATYIDGKCVYHKK
jgi:predicted amidohydrolase YtcJ